MRPLITRLFPRLIPSDYSYPSKSGGNNHPSNLHTSSAVAGRKSYGMHSLHGRSTDDIDDMGGIKVTREFAQESVGVGDASSERKLVSSSHT